MANPILSKPDAFTRRAPQGYAQPAGYDQQGFPMPGVPMQAPMSAEPSMTLDDVIAKTGATMGVLLVTAIATFMLMPPQLMSLSLPISGLVGFVTVMLVSFRRKVNPALVLFYAAVEGVFIGAFSAVFAGFEVNGNGGIVPQAVMGTFAAAFCVLIGFRYLNLRVSGKVRRVLYMTTFAFMIIMLINFGLSLAGIDLGLRSGPLGLVFALVGAALGVMSLLDAFTSIEHGIATNAPASESWRAAFGITVTMVWLYTEILRLLSYLRR